MKLQYPLRMGGRGGLPDGRLRGRRLLTPELIRRATRLTRGLRALALLEANDCRYDFWT